VAEQTGLILQLGETVLLEACRQIAALTEPRRVPLGVSVNLSGLQLAEPDIVARVAAILEKTRLDPRLLQLEVTETVLVAQGEAAAQRLRELRSWARAWRSTTSAPAIRRSATCSASRSTCSSWTFPSSAGWARTIGPRRSRTRW